MTHNVLMVIMKNIKTKIKTYGGSVITNFQGRKMPKEKARCKCSSIIMLGSVIKGKEMYYSQTLLEKCNYEQKKIKMENLTNDDLEQGSLDEFGNDSNNETESDNEKLNDKFNK